MFVILIFVVVFSAGCAAMSELEIDAQGEKLSVPVGGIAVVKGDNVKIKIRRMVKAFGFRKGEWYDAIPSLDGQDQAENLREELAAKDASSKEPVRSAADIAGPADEENKEVAGVSEGPAEGTTDIVLPESGGSGTSPLGTFKTD